MSEDRLDKVLEAMKSEDVDARQLSAAHDRVQERLGISAGSLCREFRLQFQDYLDGSLDDKPSAGDGYKNKPVPVVVVVNVVRAGGI